MSHEVLNQRYRMERHGVVTEVILREIRRGCVLVEHPGRKDLERIPTERFRKFYRPTPEPVVSE